MNAAGSNNILSETFSIGGVEKTPKKPTTKLAAMAIAFEVIPSRG